MSRLFHNANLHVGCMHLPPNGLIGLHEASGHQLLAVVQGEGWCRGQSAERTPLTAGDAVFWEAGEWHETGTDEGLMAIVFESPELAAGESLGPIAR